MSTSTHLLTYEELFDLYHPGPEREPIRVTETERDQILASMSHLGVGFRLGPTGYPLLFGAELMLKDVR